MNNFSIVNRLFLALFLQLQLVPYKVEFLYPELLYAWVPLEFIVMVE